jgi:aspartyl-tRNA(Asn)/glutamyl-tRNA(Gln) amidotransferase subunit C
VTADDVDPDLVRRVAELARLGLPDAELDAARRHLGSILGHFRALQSVDTTGVEPLVHALEAPGAPAPDRVEPFPDPRGTLLTLTAHAREGLYIVPRVLDADFGPDLGSGGGPHGGAGDAADGDPAADADDR